MSKLKCDKIVKNNIESYRIDKLYFDLWKMDDPNAKPWQARFLNKNYPFGKGQGNKRKEAIDNLMEFAIHNMNNLENEDEQKIIIEAVHSYLLQENKIADPDC